MVNNGPNVYPGANYVNVFETNRYGDKKFIKIDLGIKKDF